MRKHFTNCSFRKNLLNERVISKQDSSLQAQHYFITSYVCSTQHCRTEEKWGWTYRVSPIIFIITAATSSLASLWALVAWLLTSFLPEIAPCPPRQYPQFRDRHKNCNLKSKFRCKVFKIGLFKWGLDEFLLKVEQNLKTGLGFPLNSHHSAEARPKNCQPVSSRRDDQGCQMQRGVRLLNTSLIVSL